MATIWSILLRMLMVTGSCVRVRMRSIPSRRSRKKRLRLLPRKLRRKSERTKHRPLFFYRFPKLKMDLVGVLVIYRGFSRTGFLFSRKPPPTLQKKIFFYFFSGKTHKVYSLFSYGDTPRSPVIPPIIGRAARAGALGI